MIAYIFSSFYFNCNLRIIDNNNIINEKQTRIIQISTLFKQNSEA